MTLDLNTHLKFEPDGYKINICVHERNQLITSQHAEDMLNNFPYFVDCILEMFHMTLKIILNLDVIVELSARAV